jgi:tetratricopeptide (TPR) repeat protein
LKGLGRQGYSRLLGEVGRSEQAVKLIEEVVALDPLAPGVYGYRALVLYYARRYIDAIASARRMLQLAPKRDNGHLRIGNCLILMGRPQEALAEFEQMLPDTPFRLVGQCIA